MLLTRLPVGRWGRGGAGGAWAWPVVGMVVGLLGGGANWLAVRVGLPPLLAAAWTLAVLLLLTGALHEDGLADTADGFGGGATPARKLEIMRDSRIGSYGALALVLSLAVRGAAIASLPAVLPALVLAGALGRAAMLVPLLGARPARTEGLAAGLPKLRLTHAAAGLGIAALCAALLAPPRAALLVLVIAGGVACGVTGLARRQIGGYTGDVLGATEVAVECVVLSALAAMS